MRKSLVVMVLALSLAAGCGGQTSEECYEQLEDPQRTEGISASDLRECEQLASQEATAAPTPTQRPPRVTAEQLLNEYDANAARFNAERKGKWVSIHGQITEISENKVSLGRPGIISFTDAILSGLPTDELIPLDYGERFEATCKVREITVYAKVQLDSCRSGNS